VALFFSGTFEIIASENGEVVEALPLVGSVGVEDRQASASLEERVRVEVQQDCFEAGQD